MLDWPEFEVWCDSLEDSGLETLGLRLGVFWPVGYGSHLGKVYQTGGGTIFGNGTSNNGDGDGYGYGGGYGCGYAPHGYGMGFNYA